MQFEGLSWEEQPGRIYLFGWSVQDILEIPIHRHGQTCRSSKPIQ